MPRTYIGGTWPSRIWCSLQQRLTVDLSGTCLGKGIQKLDDPWIFIRQQFLFHVILQCPRRCLSVAGLVVHHYESLQGHAPVRQFERKTSAFPDGRMVGKTEFDFRRVDPLAGNLYEIIGAAAKEIEAVRIARKTIAGINPSTLAYALCGLIGSVPIERGIGIATHPQNALAAVGNVLAVLVLQTNLVTRNAQTRGARLFLLDGIGEINVQHFS